MNCKPGDLAIVVRCKVQPKNIGHVCRVIAPTTYDSFPAWLIEPRLPHEAPGFYTTASISDACLRPIRDPGEDARDQTLEWLPVPQKETQWT